MSRLSENLTASEESSHTTEFSLEQRRYLLRLAHQAIASGLDGQPLPKVPPPSTFLTSWPGLLEPRGVFTTLYLQGELRGCVGYAMPTRSLYQAVGETARAAAFEDSRFWPVTPEEAPGLKVSLSVLSPLFPVHPTQVIVGQHGLVISDGVRRGLLLPQVPMEHGWDRETFLAQTCHKAGLPMDAWKRSVTIEAFTAEVFGDEESGNKNSGEQNSGQS